MERRRDLSMKGKTCFAPALLLLVLTLFVPLKAEASWVKNSSGSYTWYSSSGKRMTSKWFAEQNVGFVENGNVTYCYQKNGSRYKGWLTVGGNKYYVDPTGRVLKSKWIISGDKRYYVSKNGPIYKNCIVKIGEYKYGFKNDGVMITGKAKLNKKTYYFRKENGRMVTNALVTIGDKKYYFGANGVLGKKVWVNGYYMNESGYADKNTWVGDRYVGVDGQRLTGLQVIDGFYYYFDNKTGKCLKNATKTVDGEKYTFDANGKGKASEHVNETVKPSVSVQSTYYTDPKVSEEVLLSAIIYCEAGNQPYYGQLGVGLVITNRMRSSSFPSRLKEVVYQSVQFSPTFDGALTRALKNQALITQSCKNAAKEVLQMYRENTYTIKIEDKKKSLKNYLFFMTKPAYDRLNLASPYIKLGDHVFFKKWQYK